MNVIITGATGMVGKGVLLECLDDSRIEKVLSIGRRSLEMKHPKLEELIHKDFSEFDSVSGKLEDYDACYACMGVSSAGMEESKYTKLTYDYTLALARTLFAVNPKMIFNYVSGQGTDSSEKGRSMWARVKGKTENDLFALGFKDAYMFRPGAIIPKKGVQPSSKIYARAIRYLGWLISVIKAIAPSSVVDTVQIGQAMIDLNTRSYEKKVLLPKDILKIANR